MNRSYINCPILLIEDDDGIAHLEALSLERAGYKVTVASTAAAALDLLRDRTFSLVVLDYRLPDCMDGLEFCAQIKSLGFDVPVILVTGYGNEGAAVQALRSGIRDFVSKSDNYLDYLPEAVHRVLHQVAMERQVVANEIRFRSAFEYTNVPMAITDIENRFVRVNAAFAKMFGYSQRELLDLSMQDITHPEDLPASIARRRELLSGAKDFFHMEKRYLHRDGRMLWGLTNVSIIRDENNNPVNYVGQIQDITERKQVEASLTLFRALIDRTNDCIEVIDPDSGRILDVNERACHVHGYTREEYLGLHVGDIDEAVTDWSTAMANMRERGNMIFQGVHRKKDGSRFPVEINVNYIHLQRSYLVAVVRDVTERRSLEEQLRQSQKMEAVGQLAGGVAHDFNNLLTIILGFSEILMSKMSASDPIRPSMQAIRNAGERAAALTRQLLAFSRKTVLMPQILDVNQFIGETERLLRRLIDENIQLGTNLATDLPQICVDPGQLGQILMNLVLNSRDAMPQGGSITIETGAKTYDSSDARTNPNIRPGKYVLISIKDTGLGMTADVKNRIFEPFFTTKEFGKGTGLGLAVVHGIIRQSEGHIDVASEPNKGTTFSVYLPVAKLSNSIESKTESPAAKATAGLILLVEDDSSLRVLAERILKGQGYQVVSAIDGSSAIEIARQHEGHFNLLITDVVMPKMDGCDLAMKLRSQFPEMKVLLVSGYSNDRINGDHANAGKFDFLQKPYTPSSLAEKVRELLQQKT